MHSKLSRHIVFTILVIVGLSGIAQAQLPGYEYRKKFAIDHTKVSEISGTDLTNFPVLINITESDFADDAYSSNGYDIAFTDVDGSTQLDHELEEYNSGTGEILVWVRFPTLYAASNTEFFIYYGNSMQTTDQSVNTTWDANYQMVLHMDDLFDATSNGNNGTNNGTSTTTGKLGNARDFTAINDDFISVADNATLDITGDITLSAWINIDNFSGEPDLLTKGAYNESYATWIRTASTLRFADDGTTLATTPSTIGSGATVYVTFTNSGSESNIFINGVSDVTGSTGTFSNNNSPFTISTAAYPLNGWVDEVRISNTARSVDWVNTEYLNQNAPGSFVSEVPDNPLLADIESGAENAFSEGAPIIITSSITISHDYATTLDGAEVEITGNYDNGDDVLSFVTQGGISGSWNAGSGLLTLSGTATLAQYQSALRAVMFETTSADLNVRTISFKGDDGTNYTNTVTRDINIVTELTDLDTDFPNVVFHIDAQDINGNNINDQPSNLSLVSNWVDNPGPYSFDGTGTARPTFGTNYMGERHGILFDGTNNILTETDNIHAGTHTNKSFAFVFRTGADVSGTQVIYEQGNNTTAYQLIIKNGTLYAHAYDRNDNDWGATRNDRFKALDMGSVEPNESYIIIASHNNTLWQASVNGGSIVSDNTADAMNGNNNTIGLGSSDANTRDPLTFGNISAANSRFEGYIAEGVSWTTSLSSGQMVSVYAFLCEKWCNEPPVLEGMEGTPVDFEEEDPATSITSSITITDSDNNNLDNAFVRISSNFQAGGEDVLNFTPIGSITGSFNNTTGVLSISGYDTKANYQTALRSVTYHNTSGVSPTGGVRQIDFIVYDWDDSSNVVSRDVNVISFNTTPSLSGINGASLAYDEGDGAVSPSFTASITDLDDSNMESATITISGNYEFGEDVLGFVDAGGITGNWVSGTGILTLTGTATRAQYETALENVTFENVNSDPVEGARTVSYKVNDGDNDSNTETATITVSASNSAPVLSNIESTRLQYPNAPVQITNTIEVSDPDDVTISGATVSITDNFSMAEDRLVYSTLYGISGTYNTSTGVLELTGVAPFEDYEAALRSIQYNNIATIATGPQREITFTAEDDEAAESTPIIREIDVSPVETIPDLTVWLRADAGVVPSSGQVTTWQDQSGNNNHFTGTTGSGNRPTFVATSSSFGGAPSISFVGNGDHFVDADGDDYVNGMDEFTLFLVYKSDDDDTDRGLFIAETPVGDDKTLTIRYDASGANGGGSFDKVIKAGILNGDQDDQIESFSDIQSETAQITSLHWKSGELFDIFVDGILNNPSYAQDPPTGSITANQAVYVGKGGKDAGNSSWDGEIAEVILYDRSLSDTERESVEDYLAEKYSAAIRKITAATGGEAISADDANASFTSLTGPIIQEGYSGELIDAGTIVLTAPSGFRFNSGNLAIVNVTPVYGGSTDLDTSSGTYSADSTKVTFTITDESTGSNPGQLEFSGLQIRPNTGILPNTGNITNTGTTGQGGATNYGSLIMIPGAADSLTFVQQPSIASVNTVITPAIRVQLVDQFGNEVQTAGTDIEIDVHSGDGEITGTSPVATNTLGIASFIDLELDEVGSHELIATSLSLDSEVSDPFNVVNAGTLTNFIIERSSGGNISSKIAGQTFTLKITAVDGTSTPVTTFTGTVVITSSCTMGSGQGTTSSFSSGVLASHSVSITSIGNCTITVTNSAGSETGISNSFTVIPGAASVTTSQISASPTVILYNGGGTSTITAQLKDAYGNSLTTSGGTVALSATSGSLGSVTDNANGTYTATLTSGGLGVSTITGTLNTNPITDNALVQFANFSHIWESQLGSPAIAADWFTTQNWNVGSVPNGSSVVLIPADPAEGNQYPVIDGNTTITSLTIENGAQITVSGSKTLTVTGDIAGDGDILGSISDELALGGNLDIPDISLGTVTFNGSTEQTINSPHSYINLEVDNPTTVNGTQNLSVSGTLTLTDGELLIPSGMNLISNSQSYASGTLRFQRQINGVRGWRMLSSPVESTFGDFLDGTLTQGYTGSTLGDAALDSLQPNVMWYLENYHTNREGYPATDNNRLRAPENITDDVVQGRGYWVYFFGDIESDSRYNNPLPHTLDVNGKEWKWDGNDTEVNFNVTYTPEADSGWNFVGNPFGATINWSDASKWTKTNITSTIYIWDPAANSGNGEYLTWNGTTGTLGSGLISPFQGFWIKANDVEPKLIVKKTAKTTGGSFVRKEVSSSATPVIELEASINGLSKRTNIMFNESGNKGIDADDGYRLTPFTDTRIDFFSLLSDGTQLVINNQPKNFSNRVKIPLVLDAFINGEGATGEYSINWSGMKGIPEEWIITLIDNDTGERTNLLEEPSYRLNHTTKGKAKTSSSPSSPNYQMKTTNTALKRRFTLQVSTEEIETNIPEKIYLDQNYPNPFNPTTQIPFGLDEDSEITIELFDILGRKIKTLYSGSKIAGKHTLTLNTNDLASGIYIYRLTTPTSSLIKKLTFIK